jgi:hypothetical protein
MSVPGAPQIFFGSDGSFITVEPSTNRIIVCRANGTVLLSIDTSGNFRITGNLATFNGLTLAGQGLPAIVSAPAVGADKTSAQTNFVNYTPPAAAGVYKLTIMVNVTAWTTPASFTIAVTYKDSKGNARTETLGMNLGSTGAQVQAITTVDRYYAQQVLLAIDNSATAITVSTTGTFTGSPVYQIAAVLERVI